METVTTRQRTENMECVRGLLRHKQPGFSAALESAVILVERQLRSPDTPHGISAGEPHDQ
jgi:hypothetical protein